MQVFRAIPFFRILLPYAGGVICFVLCRTGFTGWVPLTVTAVLALLTLRHRGSPLIKLTFFLAADLFLFSLGATFIRLSDHRSDTRFFARNLGAGPLTVIAYPSELPVDKGKWFRCELRITHVMSADTMKAAGGKVLAYFRKDISPALLEPGAPLLMRVRLIPPQSPSNPGQFDYRAWLERRQIYFTCFMDKDHVALADMDSQIAPVWKFGLACRKALLSALKASDLSEENYAICAALLTGQDDDIDRDTMAAFAHSGTLHILSVSGLHTGLLFLVLDYLLGFFFGKRRHLVPRFILITFFLWAFALMTGFAPPVLRAVIMFNLVGYGSLFFRNDSRNQVNLLCCSAFALLLVNPYLMFDVGFLLSYFAMFGLVTYTRPLSALLSPKHWLTEAIWRSVCASVAATLTTLPLTLYYFKQFPFWFAVCNLVVVPLSFVALLLCVLIVCKLGFMAVLCNVVLDSMKWFIALFDHRGYGYQDDLDFRTTDLFFLSLLMVLGTLAFRQRNFGLAASALSVLICWQITSLVDSVKAKGDQVLTVYHLNRQCGVSVKDRQMLNYYVSDSAAFGFQMKPHFSSFNHPDRVAGHFNYVKYAGGAIAMALNGQLPDVPKEHVTTLVLQQNTMLSPALLKKFAHLRMVVCDGSNSTANVRAAEGLCRKFGIGFYSTAQRGAWSLALK